MPVEILNRWGGAAVYKSETAGSIQAALIEALNKGANLSSADLGGANLGGADLSGAYLGSAIGLNKYLTSPLYMLLDQPGKIRAYKLVTSDLTGPHYPGLKYEIGAELSCEADPDETASCSHGLNIATLDWCMREWSEGSRILIVEHEAKDIACIPLGSDGKYRVRKLTVIAEKDLKQIGLIKSDSESPIEGQSA